MTKREVSAEAQQLSLNIDLPEPAPRVTQADEPVSGLAQTDKPRTATPAAKQGQPDLLSVAASPASQDPLAHEPPPPPDPEPTGTGLISVSSIAVLAAILLILSGLFLFDRPEAGIPENFRVKDVTPATPIEREFPDFDLPPSGMFIQVGLFRRLEGAEDHQTRLAKLGLLPHIEKRATESGSTLYAVMIGPLNEGERGSVTRILKRNNLSYFNKRSFNQNDFDQTDRNNPDRLQ